MQSMKIQTVWLWSSEISGMEWWNGITNNDTVSSSQSIKIHQDSTGKMFSSIVQHQTSSVATYKNIVILLATAHWHQDSTGKMFSSIVQHQTSSVATYKNIVILLATAHWHNWNATISYCKLPVVVRHNHHIVKI